VNKFFTPEQQREFDDRLMSEFIKAIEENHGHKLSTLDRIECEGLMIEAKTAGRAAAAAAHKAEHKCIYCHCVVDNDLEHEWHKALPVDMPKALKSRMAYGFERDKDGQWMHMNVWQCILSWQTYNGPISMIWKWGDE
jgi:hypothetical protein